MSLPEQTVLHKRYTGDGVTTTYAYDWLLLDGQDLIVIVDTVPTSAYTLTGLGIVTGGNVIFSVPPALGAAIVFYRDMAVAQLLSLTLGGLTPSVSLEAALNRAVMLVQDIHERLSRIPTLAPTIQDTLRDLLFPSPGAGELVGWNSTGDALTTYDVDATHVITSNLVIPPSTYAALPSPGTNGRLARVTDRERGLWMDTGTRWSQVTPTVSIMEFGAEIGGESTQAIQDAVNALPNGGTIVIPNYTFLLEGNIFIPYSGIHFQGMGWGSVLKGVSGSDPVLGLLTFGFTDGPVSSPVSGCGVSYVTLDGNDVTRPLKVVTGTDCHFDHLQCTNSVSALAAFEDCNQCTLSYSTLWDSNAPDQYGDGVYMGGCTNMAILYNHIYDFKRIGIVSEDGTTKSFNPLILGNLVHGGHDNTAPESISGIWVENTNGARIWYNHCYDNQTNIAGGTNSRGCTLAIGSSIPCTFQVIGNRFEDNDRGLVISTEANVNTVVYGNTFGASYQYGLFVGGLGYATTIEANHFEAQTNILGLIVVSATGNYIGRLYIGPNSKETMTYAAASVGDLRFFDYGTMESLLVQSLHNWKLTTTTQPTFMAVYDSQLTFDTTDAAGAIGATNTLEVSDSVLAALGAFNAAVVTILSANGATHTFSRVTLTNIVGRAAVNNVAGMTVDYYDCTFNGAQILVDGTGEVGFHNCKSLAYPATGLVRGSGNAGTLSLIVDGFRLKNASDVVAFKKTTIDPDILIFRNLIHDSLITVPYDMTPAVGTVTIVNVP